MSDIIERREKIIRILMNSEKCTITQLSEQLEVSSRTIIRDLHALSRSHPIRIDPGRNGGVLILRSYEPIYIQTRTKTFELIEKIISASENGKSIFLNSKEIEILKEYLSIKK